MNYSDDLTKVRGIVTMFLWALCQTDQKKYDQDIKKIMSEPHPDE